MRAKESVYCFGHGLEPVGSWRKGYTSYRYTTDIYNYELRDASGCRVLGNKYVTVKHGAKPPCP